MFRLGEEEKHSKTKEEGGNQVAFNENFVFTDSSDELTVIVMEDDFVSDDKLGEGQINISQYKYQSYPQDGKL